MATEPYQDRGSKMANRRVRLTPAGTLDTPPARSHGGGLTSSPLASVGVVPGPGGNRANIQNTRPATAHPIDTGDRAVTVPFDSA